MRNDVAVGEIGSVISGLKGTTINRGEASLRKSSKVAAILSVCAAGFILASGPLGPAQAQDSSYPSRLVRFIQPLGPGSPGDIVSRAIADAFGRATGQATIVENRVGANGILGTDACAKAPPDGYVLCVPSFAQISVNPILYNKLPYDPLRDLAPVIQFASITSAITVNASVPANSLRELIALAKAKPGVLNWGSWGVGSFSHLYMAWLQKAAGVSFVHVPYRTLGQAITGVIAGEVEVMVNTPAMAAPQAQAGKLKVLAIVGRERSPLLPEVPTLQEEGFDLPLVSWVGVTAPAQTPKAIIEKLNVEFSKLLKDSAFVSRNLTPGSLAPIGGSPEDFARFLLSDRRMMEQLAADAKIPKQ
jgi:tripartite-type tricarboxylate transporter receptor subunit TctC